MAKVYLTKDELEMEREKPGSSLDSLIRRFRKQVKRDEILEECMRREFFLKKSLKRREKSKRARIKALMDK